MTKSWGRLGKLAVVLAALSGCAPQPDGNAAQDDGPPPPLGVGLGAYLAGRFAQTHGDTRAAAEYFAIAGRRDPDNIDLQQRSFTLLVAEGRLDEAARIAERLLIIDADAALPNMLMGVRDGREGRFDAAERRFKALPQKGINGFIGPLLTAWAKVGQGQFDDAITALETKGETASFAPIFDFHRALISELAGKPDRALTYYNAALAAQTSVRTVEAAGAFLQRQGKQDEAAALYARYLKEHSDRSLFDGERQLPLGRAAPKTVASAAEGLAEAMFDTASLVRQGNAHDLVLVFSRMALSLRPDFPMARIVIGDTLGHQRRLVEANEIYRAIPAGSPVSSFARLRLAVNLNEMGEPDQAVAELKSLAADYPESNDALMAMGDVLRRHKRFPEAAQAYDAALARAGSDDPRTWALLYARGIALERSRQWARAEADFLEALRLKPDQPDVMNYLGYTWVDQGIDVQKGRALIERAVQLRPRDGAIVDSLGWALYRMGEYQEAVRVLERAAELKAEDPTINEHLGDAMWRVGRIEEARFQWKRAMSLDPEPELIEALKAKIATGQLPAKP